MNYQTYPAPGSLSDVVRFFWSLDSAMEGAAAHRLTADPCSGIVFVCRGAFTEEHGASTPAGHIAGPWQCWMNNMAHGPYSLFGAYLWPWGAKALFGVALDPRSNSVRGLSDLKGGNALCKGVLAAHDHAHRVLYLSEALSLQLPVPSGSDGLLEVAIKDLFAARTLPTVDELVRKSGLARRQFERRFKACTGSSPALFLRIVRFQRTYRMLENGEASSLTEVASAAGYFDQSHFIRDFKRFSGSNPRDYFIKAPEKVDNFVRLP